MELLFIMGARNSCEKKKQVPLIIFDWDDTLLCTSYLEELKVTLESQISSNLSNKLEKLSQKTYALLTKAQSLGNVVIVTNASLKWVKETCKKFVPKIKDLLKNILIISAREMYSSSKSENRVIWKYKAYMSVINTYSSSNIIAFGDSPHDREAILKARDFLGLNRCKSVKFVFNPSIHSLTSEISLIYECIDHLVLRENNMDLTLIVNSNIVTYVP